MPSTVARILKVNHGGEHGARRIYAARWRCPDLVPELAELLAHERRHEQMFLALMPSRAARPCRLMRLWAVGGFALGLMTGLLDRTGVFICTEAVERTVHRHLDHQLAWLAADPARALYAAVAAAVGVLTWLSTQGGSARLEGETGAD